MGSKLDSIVAVNISLAAVAVQQKGFGRGLILGASNRMGTDLFRVYTSAASMIDDGFQITDPEYLAAVKYFSAPIAPEDVMVGYAPTSPVAQVEVVTVATATSTFNYVVSINGASATFLSDSDATKAEIVTGLISAINTLAAGVTAAVITNVTDRFKVTANVPGTGFTMTFGTTKLTKPDYRLIKVDTVTDDFDYTVLVDGVEALYNSGTGATATTIQGGLLAAINALAGGVTAVAVSTDEVSVVANVEATPFTIAMGTTKLLVSGTVVNALGGVTNGLNAILAAGGKNWYGLILTSTRVKADILEAAAWIEASDYDYIFSACNDDADVLTNVATDLLSLLKAFAYLRTFFTWSDQHAYYPDAAWLGEEFPKQPGSSNYAWKTLVGVLPTTQDVLTDSKISILEGKNGNYYMEVGGINVTQSGKMAGGQFIDVIVGRDWLKSNIQAAVFQVMLNTPKVNFDDSGIGLLSNALRSILQLGKDYGILESFVITTPAASSFSSTQRGTRILPSIPWSATLAGAINKVTINGALVP